MNFSFMIYLETCSTQFNPVTNFSRLILIKLCLTNGFVGIFSFAIFIKFTPNRQRWIVVRIGQDNERPHSQYWRNTQGSKRQLCINSLFYFYFCFTLKGWFCIFIIFQVNNTRILNHIQEQCGFSEQLNNS